MRTGKALPFVFIEAIMENYIKELEFQFSAQEGSFLLQLRCQDEWDKQSFTRLVTAMKECCEAHEDAEKIDRWLADGFWYLSTYVRGHTMHPDFPRIHPQEYYEKAFQQLDRLALWFFAGSTPDMERSGFMPL
jgi:hypothetical protein